MAVASVVTLQQLTGKLVLNIRFPTCTRKISVNHSWSQDEKKTCFDLEPIVDYIPEELGEAFSFPDTVYISYTDPDNGYDEVTIKTWDELELAVQELLRLKNYKRNVGKEFPCPTLKVHKTEE